ncbi:MAG: flagellar assembly protein FliW [Dethiobacteria bacterium]
MIDLKEKDKKQTEKTVIPGKIFFKQGLPGLESYREFTLQVIENNPFFYYLQSAGEEAIGLILLDPFPCFPGYSLKLSTEDKQELQADKKEDLLVLTTVTITGERSMTTNLAAPIVINLRKGLARQIIIPERLAERRTPIPLMQK